MDTVLLLPRLLVPVRPRGQVLEQMAVVIEGEFISAVMPRSEALPKYKDATRIELPEHVLVPGFINMHTHSAMSLLRGYADDLNLQVWLNEHIWPVEKAFLGPAFVHDGVRLAIAEMLRGGTTLFNDLYFFPEITASAAVETGMRACIGLPVIDKGLEVSSSLKNEPLISTSIAPHAPYSVGDSALGRIAKISEKRDLRVHMHVLESNWEISESLSRHGKPTLERLDDVGLMNERLLAVHMTQLNGTDLEALSKTAVNVIHCPESNLKLGNGICPVARLLEHNINLALGTDDPCVLNAFQTLEMLTINAAIALGKEHQLGSVQAGKLADLCAIRLDSLQTTPMYDVVSHLIYAASSQQVTHVWVGGRMLLEDQQFLHMDTGDIIDRANDWAKRIATETRATSSKEHKIHE